VEEIIDVKMGGGVYERQKRKTTKRVHQTDVWFLVSKDTGKDFAIHRQFMRETIIPHYKTKNGGLSRACIITDNCAAQYRNKDNYSFVADMKSEFGIECTHIFPAPHHNKGESPNEKLDPAPYYSTTPPTTILTATTATQQQQQLTSLPLSALGSYLPHTTTGPWDGICGVVKRLLQSFAKAAEGNAENLDKEVDLVRLKKLVTHYAVYKHIKHEFENKGKGLEEAHGEFQVNQYYTCFYDAVAKGTTDMGTCDKPGTAVVDRTYREGDKAIMELKGSSQYQQFRGMCGLYPGCVKVRHQPCCCPEACNKGEYWNCKYTGFAGDWHDYFITPIAKHNEGNEAVRRQDLVSAAQDGFFSSALEGQLFAFVDSAKGSRQDVSFCVAKKKKPPTYSAQPAAVPSSGRSRTRGGGSASASATTSSIQ